MKRLFLSTETLLIGLLILVYILVRSINFQYHLDFSTDQALFSSSALDIYREKSPVLIGPRFSFEYDGRYLFQGSQVYYFQLIFLVLGGFDPIISTYLFVLFSSLMIIPLYIGVKLLSNRRVALLMVGLFALVPFFIDYSRFFWNPNYQFILSPLVFLFLGLYQKYKNKKIFFGLSLILGILLGFHYSFLVIIVVIGIYYFVIKREGLFKLGLFLLGILLGNLPIIIFDLRNNFYNISTLWLILSHPQKSDGNFLLQRFGNPHYFLNMSFFILVGVGILLKNKIRYLYIVLVLLILFLYDLSYYGVRPSHGFGMAADWNYLDEERAHQIIKQDNKDNFNVMNLAYDTLAAVQKYLLKKENIKINESDYQSNEYLYIITDREKFMDDPAYEIKTFRPYTIEKKWPIDSRYNLYRVRRGGENEKNLD